MTFKDASKYFYLVKPLLEAPRSTFHHASLVVFERRANAFPWNWHYHPEIELTYIHRGRGTRLVGDHSEAYGPGDLVLLGPDLPHTWFNRPEAASSGKDHQAIVLQFRAGMFPEALRQLPEFLPLRDLLERASLGLHFPAAVGLKMGARMRQLLRQGGLRRWLEVSRLLGDLAGQPATTLASAGYHHRRSFRLSSRIERITAYLDENFGEEVTLSRAARKCGLSPGAFSRFFRRMTHQTFVEYRNGCRLREVCRLLGESDLPITEIAYRCGFGNLSNFNRRFRREKKMVPRDYRRLHNPAPA